MFWLGYGLGYTTWKIQSINLNNIVESNSECEIEVQVTNTGKRSGNHVVQAYLSCVNSTVDRPALWLAGFTRVSAGPGETVRAKITIDGSRFKYWAHEWRSELTEFDLSIASDSSLRDALTHKIQIVEKK
jgi:beta-glucosidase